MRVRLESPRDSGETYFTPAEGAGTADILMEDRVLEVDDDGAPIMEENDNQVDSTSTLTLQDMNINTSEELIKRLKGKGDSREEGDSKLDVARAAFNDTVVPVAKKEVLLLDWLLDTIVKDSKDTESNAATPLLRAETKKPSTSGGYWTLLGLCSRNIEPIDLAALANRYAIPSLLQAYSSVFRACQSLPVNRRRGEPTVNHMVAQFFGDLVSAKTSKQALSIDTLHQCLDSWFGILNDWSSEESDSVERSTAESHEKILKIILDFWCTEVKRGSNNRKAFQFICDQFLPKYSRLLFYLARKEDHTFSSAICGAYNFELLQTFLHRLSYECLCSPDNLSETQGIFLEAIRKSDSVFALYLPALILSQTCSKRDERLPTAISRRKDDFSIVQQNEWKESIFQSLVSPAINIIITDTTKETTQEDVSGLQVHVESLEALLQASLGCKIYFFDDDNRWGKLLINVVKFILAQYRKAARDGKSKSKAQVACLDVLLEIHQIDETIITGSLRNEVILCALDRPASKDGLLDLLCKTSMKSREVASFVASLMDTTEMAVENAARQKGVISEFGWLDRSKGISQSLVTTAPLDRKYWQRTLGVAIRDFISPGQTVEMLSKIQARLLNRFSDVYDSSMKKRKRSSDVAGTAPRTPEREQALALAVMDTYFACQILSHFSIAKPIHQEALERLQLVQEEGIEKCLSWGLDHKTDKSSDSLLGAVLVLHDTIQNLCEGCRVEEHDEASRVWGQAASKWDKNIDLQLPAFQDILSDKHKRLPELRIQIHLSVIKRIERALLRNETSAFNSLLRGEEDGGFGVLSEMDFKGFEGYGAEEKVPIPSAQWLHGLDKDEARFVLWDMILSQHLTTFDLLASSKLLSLMAKAALYLALNISSLQVRHSSARASLVTNSKNLELRRWRDALCSELKDEVSRDAKDAKQVMTKLAYLVVITQFPVVWYPSQTLAEFWMIIFSHIKSSAWINGHFSEHDGMSTNGHHGQLPQDDVLIEPCLTVLYRFLATCLEEKENIGSYLVSLILFRQQIERERCLCFKTFTCAGREQS
jgi:hypothetical protein